MEYKRFSPKQLALLTWWNHDAYKDKDAIIADGSVRCGKTMCMTLGFLLWSLANFDGQSFAMCGKTIESLRRNVITPLHQWTEGIFSITERRASNYMEVSYNGRKNTYYIFGGKDESSAALIQGMTLSGVLFDEVALMPRSFVEQALARCSVSGSKFWFNCNPESPAHWFYLEWIRKAESKNALQIHLTMADNYSLSDDVIKRYERMYTGVFYDRYIRGLWVKAEGLIYPHFTKRHIVPDEKRPYRQYYISIDYGTLNPFSAGLWGLYQGVWYRVKEFYYDGRKEKVQLTDEEYYKKVEALAGDRRIESIIVDPSAASFIACIRRHNTYNVRKADNAVVDGIRRVANYLQQDKILISECCKSAIDEFELYAWDEKAGEKSGEDKPIKENDHAMDDIRYFCSTVMCKNTVGVLHLRGL